MVQHRQHHAIKFASGQHRHGQHLAPKMARQFAWEGTKRSSDDPLTNQFDTKLVYKRKRGGRRLSKQQRFVKRVQKALIKSLGKNRVQRISHGQLITSAGQQTQFTFALYGAYGAANFEDDMQQLMVGAFSATSTLTTNQRLMLSSARMDVYFTLPTSNTYSAFVEAYVVVPKKDMPLTFQGTGTTTLDGFWNTAASNQPPVLNYSGMEGTLVTGGGTTIIKASPFDCAGFCKFFTILEKRVYLLSPGQMASISVHVGRKGIISTEDIQGTYTLKGWTKYVMLNAWGMNNVNASNTTNATNFPAITLNVSGTRSYQMEILNDQEDANVFTSNTT